MRRIVTLDDVAPLAAGPHRGAAGDGHPVPRGRRHDDAIRARQGTTNRTLSEPGPFSVHPFTMAARHDCAICVNPHLRSHGEWYM